MQHNCNGDGRLMCLVLNICDYNLWLFDWMKCLVNAITEIYFCGFSHPHHPRPPYILFHGRRLTPLVMALGFAPIFTLSRCHNCNLYHIKLKTGKRLEVRWNSYRQHAAYDRDNIWWTPEQTNYCQSPVAFHSDKLMCHVKAGAVEATNQVVTTIVKNVILSFKMCHAYIM